MPGQRGELVRCGDERQARQRRQFGRHCLGKTLGRVQPGPDRRAALGQLVHRRQAGADGALGIVELRDERRHFLAEGDRRGVHHVGTPGLDQVLVPRAQLGQAGGQLGDRRQQLLVHGLGGGDVHGGREAVVGALRAVDVIVRVHGRLAAATLPGQFVGPPGDHLVDVHVALGAAAGLPDHQWELRVVVACQHFVRRLFDQPGQVGRQVAVAIVDPCGGLLDQRQGVHHLDRHALLTDGEVDQRALRLRPPVGLLRNFDRSQAVSFGTAHAAHSFVVCIRSFRP